MKYHHPIINNVLYIIQSYYDTKYIYIYMMYPIIDD